MEQATAFQQKWNVRQKISLLANSVYCTCSNFVSQLFKSLKPQILIGNLANVLPWFGTTRSYHWFSGPWSLIQQAYNCFCSITRLEKFITNEKAKQKIQLIKLYTSTRPIMWEHQFIMLFLQPTSTAPSVPTAAPKDVPKAPIPAEHQVLQAQFGGLVEKCIAQATNAVSKAKINFPKTLFAKADNYRFFCCGWLYLFVFWLQENIYGHRLPVTTFV